MIYARTGGVATGSWNALICGGAQVANLQTFADFNGGSSSIVSYLDNANGATGLAEWFNVYERYIVRYSSIKVYIASLNAAGYTATLVPTVNYPLSNYNGATTFDAANIDPGELPYAKKVMLNNATGAPVNFMKHSCSIKKMIGVKDLEDVAADAGTLTVQVDPYVPNITNVATTGVSVQPLTTLNTGGVFWNLVIQNPQQNAVTPGTPGSFGGSIRMVVTSYCMFTNRKILQSS